MNRRIFISLGLALGFDRASMRAWGGWEWRRARAQPASAPTRYAWLTRPVRIPLEAVTAPWRPVPFTAEAMRPAVSSTPARRVLISGVLFRKANASVGGAGAAESVNDLSALCVTCPHEQCQVDLVTDEAQLTRMVGGTAANPLFECGCHLSIFDAMNDGARIAGETPRGLYRFRIGSVGSATVEITEVEADALTDV